MFTDLTNHSKLALIMPSIVISDFFSPIGEFKPTRLEKHYLACSGDEVARMGL